MIQSRWHMHDGPPARLMIGEINATDRCEDPEDDLHADLKSWVVSSWNNFKNTSLQAVCQAIANTYMNEIGKGFPSWTYFAMVIKKTDFDFDNQYLVDETFYYSEY